MPTNNEFLAAIFGNEKPNVHVTDFTDDPADIQSQRQLIAWAGDSFSNYQFTPNSNQYFTVSIFFPDEEGKPRRRKALFKQTHCVVLDDVKEKLSLDEVQKLPIPSWILETSPGSEQWGYILASPCTDRGRVENLLDGLVSNGLAPNGRDPGMKGVTRYVRLPEGCNTKKAKMINGVPYQCQMLAWRPFNRVTIEQLAEPLHIDLNATRREQRIDGAAEIDDHPMLHIPDIIKVKEERSAGRYEIQCPWIDEHTGAADDGAAMFTNEDGTIGFKCHHGACEDRTGKHLFEFIEEHDPDFKQKYDQWRLRFVFSGVMSDVPPPPTSNVQTPPPPNGAKSLLENVVDNLRRMPPFSEEARQMASSILKEVDSMPEIERQHWHNEVREHMAWTKTEFKPIIEDLRSQWYKSLIDDAHLVDIIFIGELNQFYDRRKRIFYSAEAFQNAFSHISAEARKEALQEGRVTKVDRIDYAPKKPAVFEELGVVYGNSWLDQNVVEGHEGDISTWYNHWDALGWGAHRDHCMKFMAFTLRFPEIKINHMLIMGSGEGCGKDFLLAPLAYAMGDDHTTIQGEELLEGYNSYLLNTKYLNINETELGDRKESISVSNKLKPLAAAPPNKIRVNEKHVKHVKVRNIVNCTMTTNNQQPIKLNGASRRFYAMWSDLNPRDDEDNMLPEWVDYWQKAWAWMNNGGAEAVVWYLRNKVDLSQFDPGAPPMVTDFLREIRDSSKSPAQQTIEAFIHSRYNIFACDLLRSEDILDLLRVGGVVKPEFMYMDAKWFTTHKVSMVMKDIGAVQKRIRVPEGTVRVWILRDKKTYEPMNGADLYKLYVSQIQAAKSANPLTVVK